jgi:hypothetical protein
MKPEGITDRPGPPWELPGAVRRDCEPHRGLLVKCVCRTAEVLSGCLVIAPLAVCLVLPWTLRMPVLFWGMPLFGLAGALPSLAAWALARHDLALIRRGRMDPAGVPAVQQGRRYALTGMAVAALSFLLGSLLWLGLLVAALIH